MTVRRFPLQVSIAALLLAIAAAAQADDVDDLVSRTDACVAAWKPTAAERRFEEIGWSTDIRTALELAREHRRPLFVFTHDGRMGVGRQ